MKKEIDLINEEIDTLNTRIKEIQDNCKHNKKISVDGASTGNYDPSENCYWTKHTCSDCYKRWTVYK